MRDLEKWPITTNELIKFLTSLKETCQKEEIACGDMTLLYYDEIIARLVELEYIKND